MRVEAHDAPVDEVMFALGASFGLHYRSTAPLSRRVTGTYEGSLQRVVRRLLDGYDFVMKVGSAGVEVWVYDVAKPGEAFLAPKTVPLAKTPPTANSRREARRKRHAL